EHEPMSNREERDVGTLRKRGTQRQGAMSRQPAHQAHRVTLCGPGVGGSSVLPALDAPSILRLQQPALNATFSIVPDGDNRTRNGLCGEIGYFSSLVDGVLLLLQRALLLLEV